MNKELIELAQKVWHDTWEVAPHCNHHLHFARAFLSAVDAERGKEAVAWRVETGYDQPRYLFHSTQKPWGKSEPLFLAPQPAIPEGMALVKQWREGTEYRAEKVGYDRGADFAFCKCANDLEKLIAAAGVAP